MNFSDYPFELNLDGIFTHNNAGRDLNFDSSYPHDDISIFKKHKINEVSMNPQDINFSSGFVTNGHGYPPAQHLAGMPQWQGTLFP